MHDPEKHNTVMAVAPMETEAIAGAREKSADLPCFCPDRDRDWELEMKTAKDLKKS